MSLEKADLAPLIAAVAERDQAALRRIYEAAAAKLLGIALRITHDRSSAEDVLQDVFVRVWQRADSYAPELGEPMAWLVGITRHRAIDVVRQERARRMSTGDQEELSRHLSVPHDGEPDVMGRDALHRCLRDLEPPQRDCLVLAYCEGCSREELAARFARPVNTIKTWLRRGLLALRDCLEAA